MSLEIYSKDLPITYDFEKGRKKDRASALLILAFGIFAIFFAAGPLILWTFSTLPSLTQKVDKAPIPKGQVLKLNDQNIDVQIKEDSDGFSFFTTSFVPQGKRPQEFFISIPKMEIEKAITKVDSLNFYDNLSHFPGTALPGEAGNVFITGHSVLPQFANPKNYGAIFTKLPELEIGDVVYVELEGKNYTYVVQYKKIVDPKDLSVLKPISRDAKNLTLMTCVPPGTSLKRMVVVTSLL